MFKDRFFLLTDLVNLFPTETIVRDSYRRKSTTRCEQSLNRRSA